MPANALPITAPSYNERQQRRLGAGLTPQAITGVMRRADTGYMDSLADLLDEARQADPHLHGDLAKREWTIAGAEYELRPVEGAPKRTMDRALALCRDALGQLTVPAGSLAVSLRGCLAHLQGAVYHGRAAVEVQWARDGRYLLPRSLYPIHPRRLAWAALDTWAMHVYDVTSPGRFNAFPGVPVDDPEVFPRGKLLVHLPRQFGAYPTREGLGRGLVWYSAFKRWAVRDWLAFAEWAGRGLRVGKYATGRDPKNPARANDEDVDALRDALDAMSSTVSIAIPDVTELSVVSATDNQVHADLVKLCNSEMSKMVLGGTLTSDPGDRGARSLGEVHLAAATMLAHADAEMIAETIRRDLLGPIVRENLGAGAPVPYFALAVDQTEDMNARSKRLAEYIDRGLQVPARWVRDLESIPDPVEGEDVLGAPAAPPAPPPPEGPP